MRNVDFIKNAIALTVCAALATSGKAIAQSLSLLPAMPAIPLYFTSEDDNRLIKENDSVKYFVASGDTTEVVTINEDESFYKLFGRDHKLIAEGPFVVDGDKYLQDGKWEEQFDNGKIKLSGYYMRGKPAGEWQGYYPSGKLKAIYNYAIFIDEETGLNTCLSGSYQEFYQNGKLKLNGFYSANITQGIDTQIVADPVDGKDVVKYTHHNEYQASKTGHWEYYTEEGDIDKKEEY